MVNDEQLVLRAIDSAVFDSDEGAAGYLNPQIWSRRIEDYAKANLVVAPLGVINTELLSRPGYQLNIAVGSQLTATGLTETTSITIEKPNWTQVTVTPSEYGGAFQITRKELDRAFNNILEEKAADAGYALARIKDSTIITTLLGDANDTVRVNSKTGLSALASTDVFDTDAIADAVATMRTNNFTPKYLIIHPQQEGTLLKNSQFVNAATYGQSSVVMNGEIGMYLGLKVFTTTLLSTAIGDAGAVVYQSLVLGPRSFVMAQKRRPTIDSKYEPLDRAFTVAYVEDWGIETLNAKQIVKIQSRGD